MRLSLGARTYDLSTRALVLVAGGAPDDGAPVYAVASDEAAVGQALTRGAALIGLPAPTGGALRACAAGGAAVVVPPDWVEAAAGAGLPADRIVADGFLLDVTGDPCPLAATAVGVVRGARLVITDDVRGARRVCDVLAAVLEAGS